MQNTFKLCGGHKKKKNNSVKIVDDVGEKNKQKKEENETFL